MEKVPFFRLERGRRLFHTNKNRKRNETRKSGKKLSRLTSRIQNNRKSGRIIKTFISRLFLDYLLLIEYREGDYCYSLSNLSLQRYFLVSCTIIPERNSNDKRFGIAIRALKISAKSQTRLRLTTAPR